MVQHDGALHLLASTLDKGAAGATQGGWPTYFEASSIACVVDRAVVPFVKEAVQWRRTRLVIVLLIPVASSIDLLKYNVNVERKSKVVPSSNEL